MRSTISVVLLGLGLAAAIGCNDVRPTYLGRSDPYSPRQIQFTSEELQNDTAISGAPKLSRDPAGYLIVDIPIRSAIDHDLHVDYQTQFFDASGRVIETTAWQTVLLPANTPYNVTSESTSAAVTDFQTTFRYAK
jgi:hypothetical protein